MAISRSMTDVAYDILGKKKKSLDFKRLWQEVCKKLDYDDSIANKKLVQFHNNIMLDNRFATVENNKWDLRSRRKFEEVHVDTSTIIIEDDDELEIDLDVNEDEIEVKEKEVF